MDSVPIFCYLSEKMSRVGMSSNSKRRHSTKKTSSVVILSALSKGFFGAHHKKVLEANKNAPLSHNKRNPTANPPTTPKAKQRTMWVIESSSTTPSRTDGLPEEEVSIVNKPKELISSSQRRKWMDRSNSESGFTEGTAEDDSELDEDEHEALHCNSDHVLFNIRDDEEDSSWLIEEEGSIQGDEHSIQEEEEQIHEEQRKDDNTATHQPSSHSLKRRSSLRSFELEDIPIRNKGWLSLPAIKTSTKHSSPQQTSQSVDDPQKEKTVSFHQVHVRFYEQCVGDNPSVYFGAPVSLDWDYEEAETMAMDDYEDSWRGVPSADRVSRRMDSFERRMLLSGYYGIPQDDIFAAEKEAYKVRKQRAWTRILPPVNLMMTGRRARKALQQTTLLNNPKPNNVSSSGLPEKRLTI